MTVNILFAAAREGWNTYQAPLRQALEARNISFHLGSGPINSNQFWLTVP